VFDGDHSECDECHNECGDDDQCHENCDYDYCGGNDYGDDCASGNYDYCGICDGENVQTECYDIEECVDTFSVIGFNPWGDDWNNGSNCVNGLGLYVFDWDGGCVPDYYEA
jgi:hypothetical protein